VEITVKLLTISNGFDAIDAEHVVEPLDSMGVQAGDDTGSVTGLGLKGFVWWVSSMVNEGRHDDVGERMGCAFATHDYRNDAHICAMPLSSELHLHMRIVSYDEAVGSLNVIVRVARRRRSGGGPGGGCALRAVGTYVSTSIPLPSTYVQSSYLTS
jgi:hypothetical protein